MEHTDKLPINVEQAFKRFLQSTIWPKIPIWEDMDYTSCCMYKIKGHNIVFYFAMI